MKRYILFIFYIITSVCLSFSQKIDELDIYLFNISDGEDSIRFIKTDTDLENPKPTILFFQGSLPIPLIIEDNSILSLTACNFNYKELSDKYNLILISHPHTPVVANKYNLNSNFSYVPDLSKPFAYDSDYIEDNYLDKYVERASKVISFLQEQPWVQKDIYIMGHSQGANVAAKLASIHPSVSALGYFGGNPDGRIAALIRSERQAAEQGKILEEEAQKNIDTLYSSFKKFASNEVPLGYQGDSPHTWTSFSVPMRDEIINLQIPVYVAYGTIDKGAEGCDLLPIYFALKGKTNYMIKPYVGYGHNFQEISPDGKSNYENMKWQEAVDCFVDWLDTLSKDQ